MSNTQLLKHNNKEILLPQPQQRDFITTATGSAMAAEVTAQMIVRAKLVDSPLSECSTLLSLIHI